MKEDTSIIPFRHAESIDDPLTEIAREGARRMLADPSADVEADTGSSGAGVAAGSGAIETAMKPFGDPEFGGAPCGTSPDDRSPADD